MSFFQGLKVFLIVWILALLTFYAHYLYKQTTTLNMEQLVQEFSQNVLKVEDHKIGLSTLKTIINSKMADKSARLQYLKEYFSEAALDKEELEKINAILDGVQVDSLEKYEPKVRTFVESEVRNQKKKHQFLETLSIIKKNIPELDEALQLLVDNLYNHPPNTEL